MSEIFDVEAWRQVLVSSLTELTGRIAAFLPSLVGALVILAVGWAVSRAVEAVARRALHRLGLDRASDRLRVSEVLAQGGIAGRPSAVLARLLFWVLMLSFLLSAVETLGLTAATATIDRLVAYLPNVIAAGLIVIVGLLLVRLAGNLVGSGAAAAGIVQAARLGAAAHTGVVIVVTVVALEQLGVNTEILVTVLTAVAAALTLTLGAAFALGARQLVTHILAGHYLRQVLDAGRTVEVGGRSGIVERVGAVATLFRSEDRLWSIPNARLLDDFALR